MKILLSTFIAAVTLIAVAAQADFTFEDRGRDRGWDRGEDRREERRGGRSEVIERYVGRQVSYSSLNVRRILDVNPGDEIQYLVMRAQDLHNFGSQVSLFIDGRRVSQATLQPGNGYQSVFLETQGQGVIRPGSRIEIQVDGSIYVDTLGAEVRQSYNPPPHQPAPPIYVNVTCSSYNPGITSCRVPGGRVVRVDLIREHSDRRCIEGRSWWSDSSSISVTKGCRATFRALVR